MGTPPKCEDHTLSEFWRRTGPVLDGYPLRAPLAHPLLEIAGLDGRPALSLVTRSRMVSPPVLMHPKQAAVLPLPPLRVLDAGYRTVGDLVVEPITVVMVTVAAMR